MGREHAGPGKQICVSLIMLMLVSVTGCALWGGREEHEVPVPSGAPEDAGREGPARCRENRRRQRRRGRGMTRPDAAHTHLVTGRKLFLDGDYSGALEEYERVLSAQCRRPGG